jgi:rhamnulose-1-phosphate aldolase
MGAKKGYVDFLKSSLLEEIIEAGRLLSNRGWAERNAGNLSCLLPEDEAAMYFKGDRSKKSFSPGLSLKDLAGKTFVVKGTGMFFRNVRRDPKRGLGVVKVAENGERLDLLWGFTDGGGPTSELPVHFLGHRARLQADPEHAVIIHTHATNVIVMSARRDLDENAFTAALWRMHSECLVVFPDGVGVLPWLVPGTEEIGAATAKKLQDCRLVVWPLHGVIGAGRSIDEAMGLIETVEKAAEIYVKSTAGGETPRFITDGQLRELAKRFNLNPKQGIVDNL